MAFSYLSVIHSDLKGDYYAKGKKMAKDKTVEITRSYNNGCHATVHLETDYPVMLGFARIGSPAYSCTCVVFSHDCICDHIVATAITYDQSRGVSFTP